MGGFRAVIRLVGGSCLLSLDESEIESDRNNIYAVKPMNGSSVTSITQTIAILPDRRWRRVSQYVKATEAAHKTVTRNVITAILTRKESCPDICPLQNTTKIVFFYKSYMIM